jgi:hypothetical protein
VYGLLVEHKGQRLLIPFTEDGKVDRSLEPAFLPVEEYTIGGYDELNIDYLDNNHMLLCVFEMRQQDVPYLEDIAGIEVRREDGSGGVDELLACSKGSFDVFAADVYRNLLPDYEGATQGHPEWN